MEQKDIWTLIENGNFEEACQIADAEYDQFGNILTLRNKVYALFHLGKYEECIEVTQKLIQLRNGETSVDLIFCGIANWLLGNEAKAIILWQRGELSIYKDAAGGMDMEVILYFSSIKRGDTSLKSETIKKIKKLLKSKRSNNWPGILGHYILGDMTDDMLLSAVSNIDVLRERNLCQVYFTMAIKELEKGNFEKYYEKLRDCISYGSDAYLEQMYYLGKGELNTMPFS